MELKEFKELSEEDQSALLTKLNETAILYDDMEAERDSFKKENEQLQKEVSELKTEMKKTKELNFTLARSVKREPDKSAEDILHEMFK